MDRENLIGDVEEAVKQVCEESEDVVAAYLYGSFTRGDESEGSDVDIALLFADDDYGIHRLLELGEGD